MFSEFRPPKSVDAPREIIQINPDIQRMAARTSRNTLNSVGGGGSKDDLCVYMRLPAIPPLVSGYNVENEPNIFDSFCREDDEDEEEERMMGHYVPREFGLTLIPLLSDYNVGVESSVDAAPVSKRPKKYVKREKRDFDEKSSDSEYNN